MYILSFSDSISLSYSYYFHVSCLLQVSIHIFYMYGMSNHIQNKLIHIQWKIGTYQSHIKYIQGQIRLIHRLIHLVIVLLNFHFQKCRDPNPVSTRLADLSQSPVYSDVFNYHLKTFCLVLLNFHFQKCCDPNPRLDPVGGSKHEPGLLRHFQLSSQNILFVLLHFRLFNYMEALNFGNPINIYKFKRPIAFTFNKMHLQKLMPLYNVCVM